MKILMFALLVALSFPVNAEAEPESIKIYYVSDSSDGVNLSGYSIEGKVSVHESISIVGGYTEMGDTFECGIYSCVAEYESYSVGAVYKQDIGRLAINTYLMYSSSTIDVSLDWAGEVYSSSSESDGFEMSSEIFYNYGDSLDLGVRIASGQYIAFTEYSASSYLVGVSSSGDYFNVYLGYRFGG